jgi:ABC-2 type transport system permease protein
VRKLFKLLANENMKLYRRVRTWISVAIIILTAALFSFIDKSYNAEISGAGWKEALESRVTKAEAELSSGNMPSIVRIHTERQLKLDRYRLEHNIPPAEGTMWGSARQTSTELIQFVTIFVIIVAGDIVAGEFTWGTIKLLLIRPHSRSKILLAKYLAVLLFALFCLALLFVTSILLGAFHYGFGEGTVPYLYFEADGSIQEGDIVVNIIQTMGLKSVELVMVVTIAFMISTIYRSSSLAIGLSMFILFSGQAIAQFLSPSFSWMKYFLFTHVDLTQYSEGLPLIEGMTMKFSITILVLYFLAFNLVSWIVFRRRDVVA